jgi:hypothetical protein
MPATREAGHGEHRQDDFITFRRQLIRAGAIEVDDHVGERRVRRIQAEAHRLDTISIDGKPLLACIRRCVR